MVLIAIEELVDANPWHGTRFGNSEPAEVGTIERYYIAGSLYDVTVSPQGLEVKRDGRRLFASDAPVEIRQVEFRNGQVRYEVRTRKAVKVRVGDGAAREFSPGVTKGQASF